MNFAWDMFEFTQADCQSLAAAVKASPQLQLLHLHRSKLTDDGARLIISKLLDHPSLQVLGEQAEPESHTADNTLCSINYRLLP